MSPIRKSLSYSGYERFVPFPRRTLSCPQYERIRKFIRLQSHYNKRKECNAFCPHHFSRLPREKVSRMARNTVKFQTCPPASMHWLWHAVCKTRPYFVQQHFPFGFCHRPVYFPKRSRSAYLIVTPIHITASFGMTPALSEQGPSLKSMASPPVTPTMQIYHTFFLL